MKIYFFHSKDNADLALTGQESFVFFSSNYSQLRVWQHKFPLASFIDIGPQLQEKAKCHRAGFNRIITDFGRQYDSPAWWASRVSEKNIGVSDLFLYCCYVHIFKDILNGREATLVIIGEDWTLLESMARLASEKGCSVIRQPRYSKIQLIFGVWFKALGRIVKFLLRNMAAGLSGNAFEIGQEKSKAILIHTHIDETGLREDGVFRDRYFPGLKDWLEAQGYTVVILPVLFNIKRSVPAAWNWLCNTKQHFMNAHKLYRWSDYCFALFQSWRQRNMPQGRIILDGIDVSALFRAESDRYFFGCLDPLLYARLPMRFKQSGFMPQEVIMPFENMVNEKLFILGLRKHLPETRIVSYQHGAIYPLMLCNFISPDESRFAPMPDRVICNGEFFQDLLSQEGIPKERLAVGPALRYRHLWGHKDKAGLEKSIDILVPLPLMQSDLSELVGKVAQAFADCKDLKVAIKPHPMADVALLRKDILFKELPAHIKIVEGDMWDLLFQCRIMVAMSSSSLLESLTAGVPVVPIGRTGAIDLNPLGFFQEFSDVYYEPVDIRDRAFQLLSLSEEEKRRYRQTGQKILERCFNPVTDESMKAFLLC